MVVHSFVSDWLRGKQACAEQQRRQSITLVYATLDCNLCSGPEVGLQVDLPSPLRILPEGSQSPVYTSPRTLGFRYEDISHRLSCCQFKTVPRLDRIALQSQVTALSNSSWSFALSVSLVIPFFVSLLY